ncbi:hypothetical protein BDZ89DRAFT_1100570 [Hymenopellis radicata]|nr:hypothetical protein BDZ89DRAFT_1100570 [Hymenopellis radicata]
MPHDIKSNTFDSADHIEPDFYTQPDDSDPAFDNTTLADLVAKHGSSSSTAWLEFERYRIWQAQPNQIPQSTFAPVQGYMTRKHFAFAWGDPLISDVSALEPTVRAFVAWAEQNCLHPIWCCTSEPLEKVLADIGWSTVECIYEEVIDPDHVIELTSPESKGHEGVKAVKDLKKNLRRADKAGVQVMEVTDKWTEDMRTQINDGIEAWKKARSGIQIASTTFSAFTDEEHRRYWIALHDNGIVGILILTPVGDTSYLIKNCTSEVLIHTALEDIREEEKQRGVSITVTFGITASDGVKPIDNLSGWKITSLSKVYNTVTASAGLLKRGDFRAKFDSDKEPMYVCYPEDGFGIDGVRSLMKLLKK